VIVRRAEPGDTPALLDLLETTYEGWQGERNQAYWTWKFERNPHGEANVWIAEDEGRAAGCYIWNPVVLRAGATRLRGAQSVDAAVHPDFQGRSVFTRLARAAVAEAAELGLDVVYAFPTAPAWRGQLKVGFAEQFPVPRIHRPLRVPLAPARRDAALEVRAEEGFGPGFGVFAEGRDASVLGVQRDPAYLRWRYRDHPTQRYQAFRCEGDGGLLGYSVLRADGREGEIVDLQVVPRADAAAGALVRHALGHLRRAGIGVAATFRRPAGPEAQALRAHGFSPLYGSVRRRLSRPDHVSQFIALSAGASAEARLAGRRWALVPSDADYA
jgi:N-acetylglutamate synthase-like GNAT family acetyltransferase